MCALLWGVWRREQGLPAGWLAAVGQGLRLWPRFLGLGFMVLGGLHRELGLSVSATTDCPRPGC